MEVFASDTVEIIINTGVDISAYSTLLMKYIKPNGEQGCWDAALCPEDGNCMQHTVNADDLDSYGVWKLQAYIEENGEHFHGGYAELTVLRPLFSEC